MSMSSTSTRSSYISERERPRDEHGIIDRNCNVGHRGASDFLSASACPRPRGLGPGRPSAFAWTSGTILAELADGRSSRTVTALAAGVSPSRGGLPLHGPDALR